MAKKNVSAADGKKGTKFAKGKCSECERTDKLMPVLHYTPTGKRRIILKCPTHFQHA